jgi:hypothetical protein
MIEKTPENALTQRRKNACLWNSPNDYVNKRDVHQIVETRGQNEQAAFGQKSWNGVALLSRKDNIQAQASLSIGRRL